VSEKSPTFDLFLSYYDLYIHGSIVTIFGKMLPRKYAIKMYFIFPRHLTSASALPAETGNPEIVSFHLNAACFFTIKHETQLKISSGQS